MNLQRFYFNRLYTPVYDATVASITPYERLQSQALRRIHIPSNARVLCVGVGTGMEIRRLADLHPNTPISWVGVDMATSSLRRLRRNAVGVADLSEACMDAQRLAFQPETFDIVVCLHTMDFLADQRAASQEIVRLLKPGGQLLVSYPTGKGGTGLMSEVLASVRTKLRSGRVLGAFREAAAALGAAAAYLPLAAIMRPPASGYHSRQSLVEMMTAWGVKDVHIEDNLSYQDLIVYGRR